MKTLKENIIVVLALIGVIAPLSLLGVLIYKEIEPSALVSGFIGIVIGSYTVVFGYYFGSSSGSKTKQEALDRISAEDSTQEAKKAQWKASGSQLTFEEWLKEQK